MKLSVLVLTGLLATFALAAGNLFSARPMPFVQAAESTGTITGQVVWNAPMPVAYGVPVPMPYGAPDQPNAETAPAPAPSAEAVPGWAPGAMPNLRGQVLPVPRPPAPRMIPAGAVLVAVQGTSLSARTDENGRFRIEGVPTGQYLTLAAGPVLGATTAIATRPNVFIRNGGQTADLGRLYLGQSRGYGAMPMGVEVGSAEAEPGEVQPYGEVAP